jgi:hypothetical protein
MLQVFHLDVSYVLRWLSGVLQVFHMYVASVLTVSDVLPPSQFTCRSGTPLKCLRSLSPACIWTEVASSFKACWLYQVQGYNDH